MQKMGIPYLPYPIVIYDIVARVDAGRVTKILDVSPASDRLAADSVYEPGLCMSGYHDAGANVVDAAFAVIPCLKIAIDQLVVGFQDNLAKTAWQERHANLAAGEGAHERIYERA